MTTIVIDPEADEELLAAFDWYEARRPGLGQELTDAVDDAMARIHIERTAAIFPDVKPV